jgi:tetratricopeptide (TPR) repeat protein
VPENSRIEELQRRVQKDPASIAFAQLAEEHRRAGAFEEAIDVCRAGLEQHPGYLSARVTLGRALLESGQYEDAQAELEYVLRAAPDNLAAIRALAEIHQRREDGDPAGGQTSEVRGQTEPLTEPLTSDLRPLTSDPGSPIPDPRLARLESWLAAIVADRQARQG